MLNHEFVTGFIETQLGLWPMAKRNYDALVKVERRDVAADGFMFSLQWNPARIVSTGAKIDSKSIEERPCFLCRQNRPAEQIPYEILPGWEMLVNPFPILPVHLTLVCKEHRPQAGVPAEIVDMAEKLPGMVVFYNGASAGASAPDHLHLQAVLKDELPLIRMVERHHRSDHPGLLMSYQLDAKLPYLFFSGVVSPGNQGMATLLAGLKSGAPDASGRFTDQRLVNTFFWIDEEGLLRFVVIPRRAHRPSCYSAADGKGRMISPGCIDMAGLLILPREKDYRQLAPDEISTVFSEVAYPSQP